MGEAIQRSSANSYSKLVGHLIELQATLANQVTLDSKRSKQMDMQLSQRRGELHMVSGHLVQLGIRVKRI